MSVEVVAGKDVTIRFDGSKCIHSRNCVLSLPEVFKANVQGPWIDPDAAPADEIAALARRCPSGAIVAERRDGGANEAAPRKNVIQVLENGPYAVRAALSLGGETGVRATLCRCGMSKNKPWCDHSHADAGFTATGECASTTELTALTATGPLAVTAAPDGPLLVNGPVEIIAGSGRTIARMEKCALCRCGGSANKPFCDGTHRKIGFKST